jgi:hypothetical protein
VFATDHNYEYSKENGGGCSRLPTQVSKTQIKEPKKEKTLKTPTTKLATTKITGRETVRCIA